MPTRSSAVSAGVGMAGTCEAEARELAARLAEARASDRPQRSSLTVAVYLTQRWLPSKQVTLRISTWDGYRRNIDLYVVPGIGRVPYHLRPDHLERLYAQLGISGRADGQLGVPYVWGAETPGMGFDCSGLIQWAYAQAGISLPRTTQQQILAGTPVALEDVRPGDLVFSRSVREGRIIDLGHVAVYVGNGMVIVPPRTGMVVRLRPESPTDVQAVRRVIA